jgi:hypothetical protein
MTEISYKEVWFKVQDTFGLDSVDILPDTITKLKASRLELRVKESNVNTA